MGGFLRLFYWVGQIVSLDFSIRCYGKNLNRYLANLVDAASKAIIPLRPFLEFRRVDSSRY